MEELRLAAMAYYKNSSIQEEVTKFFKSIDTDGDERVSFHEFTQFLRQNGYSWIKADMFSQLDANKDGTLDFGEVVTFYYIVKTRAVCCDVCRKCLLGLHFTCVVCFDRGHNTYDLCAPCYGGRDFRHDHMHFLDSYVLLRSKRGTSTTVNMNMAVVQPPADNNSTWNRWFKAMELAVLAGSAGGCSIM